MSPLTLDFLEKLPKTDLHCHLDGSLRLRSILEMAEQQKVALPAADEERLAKLIFPGAECKSLEDYLKAFDITLAVLQEEEALHRAAFELAEDAAQENVRYLEVRYAPVLHLRRGLKLTNVVEAVLSGLREAKRRYGIRYGVILCGIRTISAESSVRMAELCVAYKHKEAFQLILNNNVNCTAHAGEAYGPESIAQAIHYCGAHRIGHGVRLRENGDLLNYVNDHRIPLEVCISSNVQTRAVSDFASHPLPFYYNYGLRVTINTDNRLVTNTTVSKELLLAHQHYGFSLDDLKEVIVAGFKSAFLPYREKADVLKEINKELDQFQLPANGQTAQLPPREVVQGGVTTAGGLSPATESTPSPVMSEPRSSTPVSHG